MSNNKTSPLLVGTLGVFAGVIGGLLFAPRAGKESREEMIAKVRDVFGIYSTEFREKFEDIREAVEKRLIALKKTGANIDGEKYAEIVDLVIADFKSDLNTTKDGFEKLRKYLKKDWDKVKKAIV